MNEWDNICSSSRAEITASGRKTIKKDRERERGRDQPAFFMDVVRSAVVKES